MGVAAVAQTTPPLMLGVAWYPEQWPESVWEKDLTTMERAGRLRSIAAVSYQQGALSLIELLDAQRTYNQTVTAYNQARADYQMALWQLEQATGATIR